MSRDLAAYAKSGAWSVLAQAVQVLGALVLSVVVVRSLTTEEIGVLSLARQLTAAVTVIGGLALERVLLRFVPELVERDGAQAAVSFVLRTLAVRCLGWVVLAGLVYGASDRLEDLFGAGFAFPARVGVLTALVFSIANHLRAAATARFATAQVAVASAVGSALTLALTVIVLEGGYGVSGVLVAAAGGSAVGLSFLIPAAFRRSEGGTVETAGDERGELSLSDPRFLRYATPFFAIAVLNYAVHSQTEVFFLGHWWGPESAGWFHQGFAFAQRLIDFLPLALWEVSMAGFARIAVREPERLAPALRAYLVLLYLVLLPLAAFGVGFSRAGIILLYGEKMAPSIAVSQAYFAIAAVSAFGAPIGMILYARERVGAALGAYVVFATVNLGLDAALIPRLGLTGAIIGLGAAKLLSVALMTALAVREVGPLPVPSGFLLRAVLASTPALLAWPVGGVEDGPVRTIVLLVICLALVWLAFRWLKVVGAEEAALIRRTRLPLRGVVLMALGHSATEEARS